MLLDFEALRLSYSQAIENRMTKDLKVALVHYWLVTYTGGERVLEALGEVFPQADIFTLVVKPESLTSSLAGHKVHSSFLQKFPGSTRYYRHLLPLQPLALESLDVSGYDLVISNESGPSKGVITSSKTCHICYSLSPMRYIWDMYHDYTRSMNLLTRSIFSLTAHYMRMWDLATADRVDYFLADSNFVGSRIRKFYKRESRTIYPPVDVDSGYISEEIDDYYLVAGRMVDYKRADLAILACNELRRKLHVVGEGPEYKKLKALAGPTIRFLGRLNERELREQFAHCRALIFPQEEDFGIVPVEAQSFGRPVIAYGGGGALETVIGKFDDEPDVNARQLSGIFFRKQTPESLARAILKFESIEHGICPSFIRDGSLRFSTDRFKEEIEQFVSTKLQDFNRRPDRIASCLSV